MLAKISYRVLGYNMMQSVLFACPVVHCSRVSK